MLVACGGGGDGNFSGNPRVTPIRAVGVGTNFAFDIGAVLGNRYFVTDRNNAAVDVFDTANSAQVAQVKGTGANAFKGVGPDNSTSGPDGLIVVGNLLYVGDVDSVKIVDPATLSVVKTLSIPVGGHRNDEGCWDGTHGLAMIAAPEAPTPFVSLINTTTQTVVGTVTFTDTSNAPSAGLEACRYDPDTDTFYINNDGTTANAHGELDVLPGAAVRAIPTGAAVNYTNLAGVKMYAEGNCDPTGLALGPGTDIAVGCREATTGAPLLVQIMNRATGQILASPNAGGGDQIEYNPGTNHYYNSSSRWTANGTAAANGTCGAASPCTPVLAVIDATSRTVISRLPSGNNAHSVAVDPATNKVFMPASSGSSPAGCSSCDPNDPAQLLTFTGV
jgi:hypothetical protein